MSWLRDHCGCAQCVDAASGQKFHSSADWWPAPKPVRWQETKEGRLEVQWEGHVQPSIYHGGQSKLSQGDNALDGKEALEAQRAAVALQLCPSMDYKSLCRTDGRVWALRTLFGTGLLRVRDVPLEEPRAPRINSPGVICVAERLGEVLKTFYGTYWDVISQEGAENLAYTSHPLDWHQDLLYMDSPPGVQVLHCLSPAAMGGETLFLDGVAAAQNFQKEHGRAFDFLARTPLPYHYNKMGMSLCQYRSVFGPSPGPDCHRLVYWSPHWMAPILNVPSEQHAELYESLHVFSEFLKAQPILSLRLEVGEAVVFDNRRMLHARSAFSGGSRHLQGCYLSRDTFRVQLQDKGVKDYPFVAMREYKQ